MAFFLTTDTPFIVSYHAVGSRYIGLRILINYCIVCELINNVNIQLYVFCYRRNFKPTVIVSIVINSLYHQLI